MQNINNIWGIMNRSMCPEGSGQKEEEVPMKTQKRWSVRNGESRKP